MPPGATPHTGRRAPSPWRHVDLLLVLASLAIAGFGCLMVFTATRGPLQVAGLNPDLYVKKQLIFVGLGTVLMVVVAAIDYRKYQDWAVLFYGGTIVLLLAVFVVGHKSRGSQAWFQFGHYQLEPSEVAKIGLIIALASYCASHKGSLTARSLITALVMAAVPFVLIYKQPDLGTALVLLAILGAILLMGGTKGRHLAVLGLVAVLAVVGVVELGVLKTYQKQRLTSFLHAPNRPNPQMLQTIAGAGEYAVAESKLAISDGGIKGTGIGKGSQTNLAYVPEQRTDFIFSAVGEQVGLIGSAVLLGLFMIVVWRTWRTASTARDLTGTLLCVGVLAMMVFQVFENVGMTMGIMPVAGIPLPFMSYGGSAMMSSFAAIGLVLNVHMRRVV